MSPCAISFMFPRPIPHSNPSRTSVASSLKRFNESMVRLSTKTVPLRKIRALALRRMTPSLTTDPAMFPALEDLKIAPEECTVSLDGSLKAPKEYAHQRTIIKGDQKEKIISLASVIAKVSRDTKMELLHKKHPAYHWKANKGYGTALHYKAMLVHGLTSLHRKTFLTKIK